jgi:hypothetical protein
MATARLTRRDRLKLIVSTLLLITCALLAMLWAFSYFRILAVQRRTTVESGSIIQGTDGPITEYISHTRALGSSVGRIYFTYLRADELNKSKNLPRRISWHFNVWPRPIFGHTRGTAPQLIAWSGLDWQFGAVREGGRPNGEYWSNRDIFMTVPHWMLVVLSGGGGWLLGRRVRLKRRRLHRGLCVACGYDVRMSPGRCPECGLSFAS